MSLVVPMFFVRCFAESWEFSVSLEVASSAWEGPQLVEDLKRKTGSFEYSKPT